MVIFPHGPRMARKIPSKNGEDPRNEFAGFSSAMFDYRVNDGKFRGKFDGKFEFDGKFDGKFEFDGKFDGKFDDKFDGKFEFDGKFDGEW